MNSQNTSDQEDFAEMSDSMIIEPGKGVETINFNYADNNYYSSEDEICFPGAPGISGINFDHEFEAPGEVKL